MYVNKSAFGSTVYKKHYPPALADEVWRLEKIGKDGSFHKKLNKAGIFIVEDFLRLVVRDQKKLRNVRLLLFFLTFDYLMSNSHLAEVSCLIPAFTGFLP